MYAISSIIFMLCWQVKMDSLDKLAESIVDSLARSPEFPVCNDHRS